MTISSVHSASSTEAAVNVPSALPTITLAAPSTTLAPGPLGVAEHKSHKKHKLAHHQKASHKKIVHRPAAPAWYADHDRAVELARAGDTKQALAMLDGLYRQHSDDLGVVRDYIAVLGWDGSHEAQVVGLYQTLADPDQPNYVLQEVGRAYRGLHQPRLALAVYQLALRHSPNDVGFIIGAMQSLAEDGFVEKALKVADADIQFNGGRPEVLLTAASIADQYDIYKALYYYEAVLRLDSNNREAIVGYIRVSGRRGAPEEAVRVAKEHPGIIPAAELRHLEGDVGAALVRAGMAEPSTPGQRYAVTDQAISYLNNIIAHWAKDGPSAQPDILRARYDRMLAFYNRSMMKDVIDEYNSLLQQGIDIPSYARSTAGDAYMALKEPEMARDIYTRVLQTDPHNYDVRRQLFYAYAESDDYRKAFEVVDALVQDEPQWISNGNEKSALNPRYIAAELMAGAGRLYAGEVDEGAHRIMSVVASSPDTSENREALANLYMAQGWRRAALQQYAISATLPGADLGSKIGMAEANLQLHNFRVAEDEAGSLLRLNPENPGVQRLGHDIDIYNMAELRITTGYAFKPDTTTNVSGAEGYGIDMLLYSPPINDNWRLFAGEYFSHQKEPNTEGSVSFSRSIAGGEYRDGSLTASGGLTYNHFHQDERVGVSADASWSINDQWTLAGSGETFSRDTPLRAMNQGVTAGAINAHTVWQADTDHQLRIGGDIMPFSDGNLRTGLDTGYSQIVWALPDIKISGLADLGESQNTANSNRYYYNPSRDFIALGGARAVQTLYQRYSTLYQQSLQVEPGIYMEEHYGTSAVVRVRYEQRVFFNQTFEAGLGFNFSRQSYDGAPENDMGISLDLVDRF